MIYGVCVYVYLLSIVFEYWDVYLFVVFEYWDVCVQKGLLKEPQIWLQPISLNHLNLGVNGGQLFFAMSI